MREWYFLWLPWWVHEEDPPHYLSLPRWRWGWVYIDLDQRLKITHQAVYSWKARGWVPPERAVALEAVFGVPRTDTMNPDLVRAISAPASDTF